jgi:hypothetical protein
MTEHDFNDLRRLVADRQPAPRDVVAPKGMDRDTLLALNAAAGRQSTVTDPPTLQSLDDPLPPALISTLAIGGSIIPRHVLHDAGVEESEVPNLTIIDFKRRQR